MSNKIPKGAQRVTANGMYLKKVNGIYYTLGVSGSCWFELHDDNPNFELWVGAKEIKQEADTKEYVMKKYDRWLYSKCGKRVVVDVYRVLDAFKSSNPMLDHLSKKSLCAGDRGHKDTLQDLYDIRESIDEAIALELQKQELNND